MRAYLERLINGEDLTVDEAKLAMTTIMQGDATQAQIASFFTGLKAKGETADEMAGCAQAMRDHVSVIKPQTQELVDIVGTGGDGANTFNISTTSSIVMAAAGAKVAKHGNRAASSLSGSADVLEALGVCVELPHQAVADMVDELGWGFLNAPLHHPAMKYATPVRSQLGFPTVMNLLGPLANPMGAKHACLGVLKQELVGVYARVVKRLGTQRTLVVCGAENVDELTPTGPFRIATIEDGRYTTDRIDPIDLEIDRCELEDLRGGDARMNAEITIAVLGGEKGPRRDTVLMNTAGGLIACYRAGDFLEGVTLAAQAIDSGAAAEKLEDIVNWSQSAVKLVEKFRS